MAGVYLCKLSVCKRVCGSVCSIQPNTEAHCVVFPTRQQISPSSFLCGPAHTLGSSRKTEEFHDAQLDVAFGQ